MKKDIITLAVKEVSIVVIPRDGKKTEEEIWEVYLVNEGDEKLENVIVSSKGHGEIAGREKTTTVLRYFFQEVAPHSSILVEPIQTALFDLTNEYWVSYNKGEDMLDRKFVFPANSITAAELTTQKIINKPGIAAH